jgi:hypothetical protein
LVAPFEKSDAGITAPRGAIHKRWSEGQAKARAHFDHATH